MNISNIHRLDPFNEKEVPDSSKYLLSLNDNSDFDEYLDGSQTHKNDPKHNFKGFDFCGEIRETNEEISAFDTSIVTTKFQPNNGAAAVSKLGQRALRSPQEQSRKLDFRQNEENKADERENEQRNNLLSDMRLKKNGLAKSKNVDVSPIIRGDNQRKISVMDDMFKTSGVFSKRKVNKHRKKSKFWGPDELMALMGSVAKKNDEDQ